MKEILNYLPLLAIAMMSNILCGVYYNINVKEIKFDWIKLLNGLIKATIVATVFIGVAYIFDNMSDLSTALGVTPQFIMISAVTLYTGKALVSLAKILGVDITVKKIKEALKIEKEEEGE